MKVCLVGLGYVGLTLSLALADRGIKIVGVDSNRDIIRQLRDCKVTLSEKDVGRLLGLHLNENFVPAESIPDEDFDYFVIGVGTPLDKDRLPVINHIVSAAEEIATRLKKGQTVILRSTVPVGTTRNTVIPILEKTGLEAGQDFDVVFAPERTAEGVAIAELGSNPQIIGSSSERGLEKARKLFEKMTPTVIQVSDIETAEMIKLIDNSYRDVGFAYSNEIALICEMLKIDARECIEKANYKYERNRIPMPSPGVGGPCLSKDPHILAHMAKKLGYETRMISGSRLVNEFVPSYLGAKIVRKIKALDKGKSAKIFVVGFAFKGHPETDDIRNSPTLGILEELQKHFDEIVGYDSIVSDKEIQRQGIQAVGLKEGFSNADCVIIVNNHQSYRSLEIEKLLETAHKDCVFVDCWGLYDKLKSNPNIRYTGVGIE